jgi:hypothetical protein
VYRPGPAGLGRVAGCARQAAGYGWDPLCAILGPPSGLADLGAQGFLGHSISAKYEFDHGHLPIVVLLLSQMQCLRNLTDTLVLRT